MNKQQIKENLLIVYGYLIGNNKDLAEGLVRIIDDIMKLDEPKEPHPAP